MALDPKKNCWHCGGMLRRVAHREDSNREHSTEITMQARPQSLLHLGGRGQKSVMFRQATQVRPENQCTTLLARLDRLACEQSKTGPMSQANRLISLRADEKA
jgi:hypothetical protein